MFARGRQIGPAAFVACTLFITLLSGFYLFSLEFEQAGAYPPPEGPQATANIPYPAPPVFAPSTPIATPQLSQLSYQFYLPFTAEFPPAWFSVAGGGTVADVVPVNLAAPPYNWNNLNSPAYFFQMLRSCLYYRAHPQTQPPGNLIFYDWYKELDGQVCWDPISQKLAEIEESSACPYGKPCLDITLDPTSTVAVDRFQSWVHEHPNWIWVIGNEPDNRWQDAIVNSILVTDDVTTWEQSVGGSTTYATFFAEIYTIAQAELETIAPGNTPRLVFCQSTVAYDPVGNTDFGLEYCKEAYEQLLIMEFGPDNIYAVATHQYLDGCKIINGSEYCNGELLDENILEIAVQDYWIAYLQEFEEWTASVGLGDKPLWLTEFGSLKAWCHETHPAGLRPGVDQVGGLPCLGEPGPDNVFYGRNDREGVWGLQTQQLRYLVTKDPTLQEHFHRWQYAWWFVVRGGRDQNGNCGQTVWLWGANYDCTADINLVSRAGDTYRDTLDCILNGQHCPVVIETVTPTPTPGITPTPSPTPPTVVPDIPPDEDPICKETEETDCPDLESGG